MTVTFDWASAANGDWTTADDWSQPGFPEGGGDAAVIAASGNGYTVSLVNGDTLITVASLSITYSGANFSIESVGGAETVSGDLLNDGAINLDDQTYGVGGSTLSVGGTLTNANAISIGGSALGASTTLEAGALNNTGALYVTATGLTTADTASVLVASAAGFGTAGVLSGQVNLNGNVLISFAGGGQIGTIASGARLQLYGAASVADAGSGENSALTGLTVNGGELSIEDNTLTLTGSLDNTGGIDLDDQSYGVGGSTLSVAGTLTNANVIAIGGSALGASTTLSVGALNNTGALYVTATGLTTADTASVLVASAAGFGTAGVLSGQVNLNGNVLISFAGGGQIGTIASGARLQLYGAASVADAGSGENSALTGLTVNGGELSIEDNTLTLTGSLDNTGGIDLDDQSYGVGGSTLSVAGTLTNANVIAIGGSALGASTTLSVGALNNTGALYVTATGLTTADTASVLVASAAGFGTAGVLTGQVNLTGNVLLSFAGGGEIGTIASGAQLLLWNGASVSDAGGAANSALAGLTDNAGELRLQTETLSVSGNLLNAGGMDIDDQSYNDGGSTLSVGGTLTNTDYITIGRGDALGAAITLEAAALDNTGALNLSTPFGSSVAVDVLIGSVAGFGTAGVLTGQVNLNGNDLISFASGGSIGTIASGAQLLLWNGASVSDAGGAANSALAGLTDNAGELRLQTETLSVSGNLLNAGGMDIDDQSYNDGGSTLSVGGTLTNTDYITIGRGDALGAAITLEAAALDNTGALNLSTPFGSSVAVDVLIGSVAGFGTAGVLTGQVNLNGNDLISFASGGSIGTIASGAQLLLWNGASVSDAGGAANSALAGLTDNAGELRLQGETLTVAGNLLNAGGMDIDDQSYNDGGSTLSVGGTLTNSGNITIGRGDALGAGIALQAGALDNTNYFQLSSASGKSVAVTVTGTANNSGRLYLNAGATLAAGDFTQTDGLTQVSGTLGVGVGAITGGEVVFDGGAVTGTSLDVGANASLTGSGVLDVATLSVEGLVEATGALTIDGKASGMAIDVAPGATVALNGTISNDVLLRGNFDLVDLVSPATDFTGTIESFGSVDTLVIQNIQGTSASYDNGVLTVDAPTGDVTIAIAGNFAADAFRINPTALDETVITLGSASQALTISGPASLNDTSNAAIPVSPLTFTDTAVAADTIVATAQYGLLSANAADGGSVSGSGSGKLTLTGSAQAVSDELGSLTYNSNSSPQIADTIALQATDDAGEAASTLLAVTLDQPPTITLPAIVLGQDGTASSIGAVSIAHIGDESGEITTITLSDQYGVLAATAEDGGSVSASGTLVTLAGTLAAVNAELATVTFDGTLADTLTVSVADGRGGTATAASPVVINTPPSISANATVTGFATVPLSVPVSVIDAYAQDAGTSLTATISDTSGLLTATASGAGTVSGDATTTIVLTGTLAALNAELGSLQFTGSTPDTIDIAVGNGAGQTGTATIATALSDGPSVNAPVKLIAQTAGSPDALFGISVTESGPAATTLTVTLSDLFGTLDATGADGAGVSGSGSNQIVLTGDAAAINATLGQVLYTGAVTANGTAATSSDTLTIAASDPGGTNTADIALTVGQVPYFETALDAFNTLGGDETASASLAQIDADAAAVYTASILGALGTVGGATWEAAFAASNLSAETVVANLAAGDPTTQVLASTLALYGSMAAGLLGTMAGGGSQSAVANIQSAAAALASDIAAAAALGTLQNDVAALYAAIQAAAPNATNASEFQQGTADTLPTLTTLSADQSNGASGAQILTDATAVYDSVVATSLGAIDGTSVQQAYSGSGATVGAVGAAINADAGALPIDEAVAGAYETVASEISNPGSLVTYGDVVTSAQQFAASIGGATGSAVLANSVPLFNTVGFAIVGGTAGVGIEQDLQSIQTGLIQAQANIAATTNADQIGLDAIQSVGTDIASVVDAIDGPTASAAVTAGLAAGETLGADTNAGTTPAQFIIDGFSYFADLFSTLDTTAPAATGAATPSIDQVFSTLATDIVGDNENQLSTDLSNLYEALFTTSASTSATAVPGGVETEAKKSGSGKSGIKVTKPTPQQVANFVNSALPVAKAMTHDKSSTAVGAHLYDIATLALNQFSTATYGKVASNEFSYMRNDLLNWLGDISYNRPYSARADLEAAIEHGSIFGMLVRAQIANKGQPLQLSQKSTAYLNSVILDDRRLANDLSVHASKYNINRDLKQLAGHSQSLILNLSKDVLTQAAGKVLKPVIEPAKAVIQILDATSKFGKAVSSAITSVSAKIIPKHVAATTGLHATALPLNEGTNYPYPRPILSYQGHATPVTVVIPTTPTSPTSDDTGSTGGGGGGGGGHGGSAGDVHLTTLSGLYYNFQAAGEFVLSKSTAQGDTFEIQVRLQPWNSSASVSVATEAAVQVGSNSVTFDINRDAPVWENGAPISLANGVPLDLGDGTLTQLTAASWEILWDSGEVVTIANAGTFLNISVSVPANAAGTYEGLLGNDNGNPTADLVLPDGTVLAQPMTYAEEYTTLADAYRVSQSQTAEFPSLLNYGTNETTATFTDLNFPADAAPLANLPATVLAAAQAAVAAAGITNPAAAASAEEDYALTGNATFITTASAAQGNGAPTIILGDPTPPAAPPPSVGIVATTPNTLLSSTGTTELTFQVYTTAISDIAQTLTYEVETPDPSYLGASYFANDTLPAGTIILPAGQISVNLTIDAFGTIGDIAAAPVEVALSSGPNGESVAGTTAIVTIDNNQQVVGTQAIPAFINAGGTGTLTAAGNVFTLSLGTIEQDTAPPSIAVDVANTAGAGANTLFGNFTSTDGGAVYFANGLPPVVSLNSQQIDQIAAQISTTALGAVAATITFEANAENASGYKAALTPITLDITGAIVDQPPTITIPSDEPVLASVASTLTGLAIVNSDGVLLAKTYTVTLSDASGLLAATAPDGGSVSGSGSTTVTLSGSLAAVNAALATVSYTGAAGETLSLSAVDNAGGTGTASVPIVLDTAPTLSAPGAASTYLGEAGVIGGVSITDATLGAGTLTVTLADAAGKLALTAASGASVIGAGTTLVTATGQLAAINATLATLTDIGAANPSPDTIDVTATDALGLSGTADIAVTASAPPPPELTLPSSATAPLSVPGAIAGLSVSDPGVAGAGGTVTVTLSDTSGTLYANQIGSATVSGSGSATLTLTGAVADVSAEFGSLGAAGPSVPTSDTIDVTATGPAGENVSGRIPVLFDTAPTFTAPVSFILPPGTASLLTGLSVTDPGLVASGGTLTLTLSDTSGVLAASATAGVTIDGGLTPSLTLIGAVGVVASALVTVTDTGPSIPTLDHLTVSASDAYGLSTTGTIGLEFDAAPTIIAPGSLAATIGVTTPIGGVTIDDPGVSTAGTDLTVTISDPTGLFTATAQSGVTIEGAGGTALTLIGTVAGIDATLGSLAVDFTQNGSSEIGIVATDPFGQQSSAGISAAVACFAAGTRIRTEHGEVAVEALREGDRVVTVDGLLQPIVWIGRRRLRPAAHPQPALVHPVRVTEGAFGPGLPRRDLYLSPEHAIFTHGVLIPVRSLVNGTTIVQVEVREVTYFHVELARHDILLAEGLPAESWLDTGSRGCFENAPTPLLHPDFRTLTAASAWAEQACAMLVEEGPLLDDARLALAEHAERLGIGPREHVVEADRAGMVEAWLPAEAEQVRIRSPHARGVGADVRRLGCAITGVWLDAARVTLDDARLRGGFHPMEGDGGQPWRWTDGDALLVVGGATERRLLRLEIVAVADRARAA